MTMKDLPVVPVYTISGDSVATVVNPSGVPFTDKMENLDDTLEHSYTFPLGTKRFLFRLDKGPMTYGYISGALNFILNSGTTLEITNIDPERQITVFFKTGSNLDTLRLDYWK